MKQPNKITVYSKGYCPFCKMAKATLNKLGLRFEELDITNNAQLDIWLPGKRAGRHGGRE